MAKGSFTPSTVATNNITALPPVVVGQAVSLQPLFDKGTLDTKTYINSTLIAELNGDDGANKIGCNPSNLASDNVKEALEELQTNIQNTAVGAIPDGSLTDVKLSNTAGQIKDRVATAEAEIDTLQADVNFIESDSNYSLATIVSRQIRITKTGTLPTTNFKISAPITVGAQLTISLDSGATSLPLVDTALAAVTSIESGVHQVIFDTTRYILNPFGQVGGLASLSTTTKASTVAAINELDGEIGTLASLLTTDKTNLVAAVNEVKTENRATPTPGAIAAGFLATWSGSIIHRKNLEGMKNLNFNLDRSSDISNASTTVFTLPADLRPTETLFFFFQGLSAGGTALPDASISLTILTDGQMLVYSSGLVTVNVRKMVGNISYY